MEWQDIEIAPKYGTEITGCFSNDYGYQDKPTQYGPWTIRWDGKEWVSSWDGYRVFSSMSDFGTDYHDPDIDPTHWQPVPSLPSPPSNT